MRNGDDYPAMRTPGQVPKSVPSVASSHVLPGPFSAKAILPVRLRPRSNAFLPNVNAEEFKPCDQSLIANATRVSLDSPPNRNRTAVYLSATLTRDSPLHPPRDSSSHSPATHPPQASSPASPSATNQKDSCPCPSCPKEPTRQSQTKNPSPQPQV